MHPAADTKRVYPKRGGYTPPVDQHDYSLKDLLLRYGRATTRLQHEMSNLGDPQNKGRVYYAGCLGLLEAPSVSIVGTREVSEEGWKCAYQLARTLSRAGVTIVSGLAKGVDTAALTGAIDNSGCTVAVIGTPLDKAYPAENAQLQQTIYNHHLLITPFANGTKTFRSNFPVRNRVMAAVSDATIIIEASDTSGTLHQASECLKLDRWLFIAETVVDDASLTWPSRFLGHPKTVILKSANDVLDRLGIT